ncbi:MAG: hypothetical protein K9K67_05040 [Bacteriovoracaceae bacterium]|nr:hypothetical protein [Bacteriovoracaceae bacterium]
MKVSASDRKIFENAFPKECKVCGSIFSNYQEFIDQTLPLTHGDLSQGPKRSVLAYRNCTCGSTITIKLEDLRDYSEEGQKRRQIFKEKLIVLLERGIEEEEAIEMVKKEMKQ